MKTRSRSLFSKPDAPLPPPMRSTRVSAPASDCANWPRADSRQRSCFSNKSYASRQNAARSFCEASVSRTSKHSSLCCSSLSSRESAEVLRGSSRRAEYSDARRHANRSVSCRLRAHCLISARKSACTSLSSLRERFEGGGEEEVSSGCCRSVSNRRFSTL